MKRSKQVSVAMIENRIIVVRGQKVMLDSDLAVMYGVTTAALNQAVKRNSERFPTDFMFRLTMEETTFLISQTVISNETRGGRRKPALAFTEQGVAMLSSVLKSKRAVAVNIEIMRVFVKLRQLLLTHADLARKLDALEKKYDAQFKIVFDVIRELMTPVEKPKRRIGF
jgi:hypothetical protein